MVGGTTSAPGVPSLLSEMGRSGSEQWTARVSTSMEDSALKVVLILINIQAVAYTRLGLGMLG